MRATRAELLSSCSVLLSECIVRFEIKGRQFTSYITQHLCSDLRSLTRVSTCLLRCFASIVVGLESSSSAYCTQQQYPVLRAMLESCRCCIIRMSSWSCHHAIQKDMQAWHLNLFEHVITNTSIVSKMTSVSETFYVTHLQFRAKPATTS